MTMAMDRALEDLLEHLRSRFYGKYRGVVTDVDAKTCRIKAEVPAVLRQPSRAAGACHASRTQVRRSGSRSCPKSGAPCGSSSRVAISPTRSGAVASGAEERCPATSTRKVKVIVTSAPFELKLDDTAGSITLTDHNGNTVTLDSSGIKVANGGQQVVVSSSNVTVNNGALQVA